MSTVLMSTGTSISRRRTLITGIAVSALILTGCADPTDEAPVSPVAAQASQPSRSGVAAVSVPESFNTSADQQRVTTAADPAAVALLPEDVRSGGRLVVAGGFAGGGLPPLGFTADDNKTPIGIEVDIAHLIGDKLGLTTDLQVTSWEDIFLGVDSGKYQVAVSNVGVSEARKQKYDFATHRLSLHAFEAKKGSALKVDGPADIAGKKVAVGSGTLQEGIVLNWDEQNRKAGLAPVDIKYYQSATDYYLALSSGRIDVYLGPNPTATYHVATTGQTEAERGTDVVLVDRFDAGHDRGASHGSSRIFRHAYANVHYVRLAAQALRGWKTLQQLTGQRVLELTGAVDHGDPEALQPLADALDAESLPSERLDPIAAGRRWPGLRFDTEVLRHPAAGRVHADHAVAALQAAAVSRGAQVQHGRRGLAIEPDASGVLVQTDAGALEADQVVVAAGAWTSALVEHHLGYPVIRTTQEQPAHFALLETELAQRWPSFIHHPGAAYDGPGIYGLHSPDGVKVGEHGTGPIVDPDARSAPDRALTDRLVDYVRHWIPGVDSRSGTVLSCLYSTTPDHDFVIDRRDRITVAGGFSGHGFKFGPGIGDLVADLVLDGSPANPLFGLDRFRVPVRGTTRR